MATDEWRAGALVAARYRLLRPVGSGGLGAAWLARDEASASECCLKLVRESDPAASRLLRFEFEQLRAIDHPHLLGALDFGVIPGDPPRAFFTSRYVAGGSLARAALEGPALERVLAQTALALGALHRRQLVHGDVKADNVMID